MKSEKLYLTLFALIVTLVVSVVTPEGVSADQKRDKQWQSSKPAKQATRQYKSKRQTRSDSPRVSKSKRQIRSDSPRISKSKRQTRSESLRTQSRWRKETTRNKSQVLAKPSQGREVDRTRSHYRTGNRHREEPRRHTTRRYTERHDTKPRHYKDSRHKSTYYYPDRHYRSRHHHYYEPRYHYYYPSHGYVHFDDDAFGWLAFTAIALKLLDNLNEQQQREHEAAMYRATTAPIGETIVWSDESGSGSVTPTREGTSSSGRYCREFQHRVTIGGETQSAYGTACRAPDGSWEILQ